MLRNLIRPRAGASRGPAAAAGSTAIPHTSTASPSSSTSARLILLCVVFALGLSLGRIEQQRRQVAVDILPPLSSSLSSSPHHAEPTTFLVASSQPPQQQTESEGLSNLGRSTPSRLNHPVNTAAHGRSDDERLPVVADADRDDASWPLTKVHSLRDVQRFGLDRGSRVHCIDRGMQSKCLFENLVVARNQFFVYDSIQRAPAGDAADDLPPLDRAAQRFSTLRDANDGTFPNPLYPPDGQLGPLRQYHKYKGHKVQRLPSFPSSSSSSSFLAHCTRIVTRPTIFLYRMSGHSTYHLWENNLGPFYATLLDNFDLNSSPAGGEGEAAGFSRQLQDEHSLLISFVDDKPRAGPKAPHLLDQLLRVFTDTPLLNASALGEKTCFLKAIVGTSASRFPHRALVREIQRRMLGIDGPRRLPEQPRVVYVSRNHPKVVRGRKMMNQEAVVPILNETVLRLTGRPLQMVHMEDYSYHEQVRLAADTHIMLSPHGGGVANCIWMAPGAVVIEFVAPVGKTLPGMYHTMCGNSGVQHFSFLADPDPVDAGIRDNARLFSNLIMPPERLVENFKKGLEMFRNAVKKQQQQLQ